MIEGKTKVAFKTLGCRLNQFETSSLATQFKDAGYELVHFNTEADVYIINTCTVTNQSDHKSRNIISQAGRRGEGPIIIVTGCMAESNRYNLLVNDKVTHVVGNDNKSDIFSLVDAYIKGEVFQFKTGRNVFDFQNPEKIYKTRGTIKIQDGCDNYCTFCIIPFVRGRAISQPTGNIYENARQLIENGYHEIVVTGVNIGRYKYADNTFEDLIKKLLNIPGDFRLRISSMEPDGIGEKFLDLINHPKMCPHLHLCLQSGSDRILKKMRRMYNVNQYMQLIDKIRNIRSDFNFTTDILVGFPGETEEDFKKTLDIIEQVKFGHIHTFKYSKRYGTRAASMEEQISDKVKNERSQLVRKLSEENKLSFFNKLVNKEQIVLVERKNTNGFLKGYGEHYVPVEFEGDNHLIDTFQKVKIKSIDNKKQLTLVGEINEVKY